MRTTSLSWRVMTTMASICAAAVWTIMSIADGRTRTEQPRITAGESTLRVLTQVESIHPTLEVHTGYNQTLSRFMVELLVGNLADAENAIEKFGVANIGRPTGVRNPAQWQAFYGVYGRDSALVWTCWDTLTLPPPDYSGANTYKGPYVIDPGDTVHRFQMFLDYLPATFHYYAWGYDTIPGGSGQWQDPFTTGWSGTVNLDVTAVRAGPPKAVQFMPPRPNPASHVVSIGFALPHDAAVRLSVFDVRGAKVRDLVNGMRQVGTNVVTWDGFSDGGKPCAPGAYYARLTVEGKVVGVRRITILR